MLLLPSSWRWRTTLDCEIPSSPDTLRSLLTIFTAMPWSMASESTTFGLPDRRPSCNLSSRYSFCCTFIYAAFKSHREKINAQHVSTPTTVILPIIAGTFHGLNCVSHMLYTCHKQTFNLPLKFFKTLYFIFFPTPIYTFSSAKYFWNI